MRVGQWGKGSPALLNHLAYTKARFRIFVLVETGSIYRGSRQINMSSNTPQPGDTLYHGKDKVTVAGVDQGKRFEIEASPNATWKITSVISHAFGSYFVNAEGYPMYRGWCRWDGEGWSTCHQPEGPKRVRPAKREEPWLPL